MIQNDLDPNQCLVGSDSGRVQDPYSLNPDPNPAKNLNQDLDPVPDPSYFLPLSEFFKITYKYKIFSSKEVNLKTECCKSR